MPAEDTGSASEPESDESLELTDVVKSRIVDRVLRELAEESPLGGRPSRYTRSSLGVYGKYEKYDADVPRLLEQIRSELERMVSELDEGERGPGVEEGSSDEPGA